MTWHSIEMKQRNCAFHNKTIVNYSLFSFMGWTSNYDLSPSRLWDEVPRQTLFLERNGQGSGQGLCWGTTLKNFAQDHRQVSSNLHSPYCRAEARDVTYWTTGTRIFVTHDTIGKFPFPAILVLRTLLKCFLKFLPINLETGIFVIKKIQTDQD